MTFRLRNVLAIAVVLFAGVSAQAAVFTTSASFLANVAPGSFFNNFAGVPGGLSNALNFAGGGFSYTIDSAPTPNNLFNDPGIISTNLAAERISIVFTGNPVTAVGGNFWSTDIAVQPTPSTVTVMLSDGTTEIFNSAAATDYRGFTSAVPITSMTIDAGDTPAGGPVWPTLDNLTVGRVIPEPASLSLVGLGLAALAYARRR